MQYDCLLPAPIPRVSRLVYSNLLKYLPADKPRLIQRSTCLLPPLFLPRCCPAHPRLCWWACSPNIPSFCGARSPSPLSAIPAEASRPIGWGVCSQKKPKARPSNGLKNKAEATNMSISSHASTQPLSPCPFKVRSCDLLPIN